ncbi:MAG: ATP-binding protein [Chitinispirillales bacterium]|jgi:predicted AAA+ superfamily ATPase|nr:ATP-binding protein [Chitinispirillales bacterium]
MKRYAMDSLKRWKNSADRKPLMIYGARQVGKTWLMKEFGRAEFGNTLYVSFDKNERARQIFGEDIDPRYIVSRLENDFDTQIDPRRTLLIFDEIQECQRAKDALKYFCENAPEYHVVAAGSFLGVATGKFPVGQVNTLTVRPMSFYEFLEAIGRSRLLGALMGLDSKMILGMSQTASELLRAYFYVGGMPKAVQAYADTGDIRKTRELQEEMLDGYRGDFSKHIKGSDIPKVRMLWDTIPAHLAKEKKKFVYKEVKTGGRASEFENAMNWLENTGLVHRVSRTQHAKMPLLANLEREHFKIFMADIGLLCAHSGVDVKTLAQPEINIFDNFRGALTEQFVLQELKALLPKAPILYWANERGHSEVDFVFQYEGEIIPIEAKSSENARAKSLKAYMDAEKPARALRTSLKNFGAKDNLISVPLYMMGSLLEILDGKQGGGKGGAV